MAREVELAAVDVLTQLYGPPLPTPDWLIRPGKTECLDRWELVREIYHRLTSLDLPDVMRPVERRTVDGVFNAGDRTFVFELDESQHFNGFRATTLRCYPESVELGFDKDIWIEKCQRKTRLEGGGFAKPKPPLFPGENGRHKQRAFRDALSDLVPPLHGYAPTLRLADTEVAGWIEGSEAAEQMQGLASARVGL